jgi:tRNA(Ile)-lysidine synthetase-like protein
MNRFETRWLEAIRTGGDGVKDTKVLVACSGGGDSVALLAFLWAVRRSLGLELMVAHAHHGLRPEAEQEADLVRGLCRSAGLDLVEARLDVRGHAQARNLGLETAARELRWAWLRSQAAAEGATAVATGHTLDDHTETVLVRLARGGGAGCLTPLPRRQDLRWSPLVQARRADLRGYLARKGVPWLEDASNQDPFTPRNRWRRLLEPMRAEAPALDQHLWETHCQVRELAAFRDRSVGSWRGVRWQLEPGPSPLLLLGGRWEEPELRWTLEAAFRECQWPREADLLRDLAAWMLPHLARRPGKPKEWGGWRLAAAGTRDPAPANGLPDQGRLGPWALGRTPGP